MSYLGRIRQGAIFDFVIATGKVGLLDAEPTCDFYADDDSCVASVVGIRLTADTSRIRTAIDDRFAVGTFRLDVRWSVSGVQAAELDYVEVVPGGDAAGAVISLDCRDRPEATYLLAQLDGGLALQGKNPTI